MEVKVTGLNGSHRAWSSSPSAPSYARCRISSSGINLFTKTNCYFLAATMACSTRPTLKHPIYAKPCKGTIPTSLPTGEPSLSEDLPKRGIFFMPSYYSWSNISYKNPTEESDQTASNKITTIVLGIFFISLLGVGMGQTAVYTLGIPYIDDNVACRESPLYFGECFLPRDQSSEDINL